MTKMTRRERLRQETTQEIVDTARAQMAKHGASALSLRAIARDMGMTAPAIYRYFKDRDALVTALIGDAFISLTLALEEARQKSNTSGFQEQLMAVGLAYRQWGITNPSQYSLIFGTPIPGYQAPLEIIGPIARNALFVLINVVKDGLASGELHAPDKLAIISPESAKTFGFDLQEFTPLVNLAGSFWAHVHGLTSLELYGQLQPFLPDAAEFYELELTAKINCLTNKDSAI